MPRINVLVQGPTFSHSLSLSRSLLYMVLDISTYNLWIISTEPLTGSSHPISDQDITRHYMDMDGQATGLVSKSQKTEVRVR